MRQNPFSYKKHRLFLTILFLCLVLSSFGPKGALPALAQGTTDTFTIKPGNYQVPEALLTAVEAKLGEIRESSGGATSFGVGYYEEHSAWAWINLLVADGAYFDENEIGPSFLYFAVRDGREWRAALSEDQQDFRALLDSISRDGLSSDDLARLQGYYGLNQARPGIAATSGGLLFPWPASQNSWRFGSFGFHAAGFSSLGMEVGAQAIDLMPPSSLATAKVLAMETGTVVNKLDCTWNTVLIVRHDGYADPKRFLYLHIQKGTSPTQIGMPISVRGQYLGDLRIPVFNGYWSGGTCSGTGSGPFNCERDLNPATGNLCSSSDTRHLHLGFGTDKNIVIDGNAVASLSPGSYYHSTNQERDLVSFEDNFNSPTLHPFWHWYKEDPSYWSLTASPGYLRILTQSKDIRGSENSAPLLLQSLQSFSGDDFDIQTRVVITPTTNFQQGGLVIYSDYDNYVRLTYAYIDGPQFEFIKEVAGDPQPIQSAAPPGSNDFHLRIAKRGTNYLAYYSQDGANWTLIATHQNVNISPLEVGLLAFHGVDGPSTEVYANFDYFQVSTKQYTFADVLPTYWAWDFIERLYSAGITGGCSSSPLKYCPETVVNRAQMAVFLLRGIHGSSYNPPGVEGDTGFGDVPPDYWAAPFIKQLVTDGITVGCGSGNYCPELAVTRAQMAVFLLRSKHGASYNPPLVGSSTGFSDVPLDYWAAAWIKQLVAEGITAGCGAGTYCPESPVTRAQMAVFLVRTFDLP